MTLEDVDTRLAALEAQMDALRVESYMQDSAVRGALTGQKIDLQHLIESLAEMRRLIISWRSTT